MRNPGSIVALSLLLAGPAGVRAADVADPGIGQADNPFLELAFDELMDIALIGKGESRQVQTISREDTRLLLPGTSPFKALEKLPGVHFGAADAWGNYEWSMRIGIRGFRQGQLGFTLDDIPLGDMDYGNNNGLSISRALIAENLERIELAQGSGAVGTASNSNLGGTLRFHSREPTPEAGLVLGQTLGENNSSRTHIRAELGQHGGWSGYLGLVRHRTDKWKGFGEQAHDQLNGRLQYRFGEHRVWGFYSLSRRKEADYMDLSLDSRRRLGWDWDYYIPDWQRALDAAAGELRGGVTSIDDAYFSGRGLRDDDLASLGAEFNPRDDLRLRATAYHHRNDGQGHWYTPYNASTNGVPISIRTTEYYIGRGGIVASLTWKRGRHEVQTGLWYEDNRHEVSRNFYDVSGPAITDYFLRDPSREVYAHRIETRTLQLHLRDRITFLDERLTLDIGLKSLDVDSRSRALVGGSSRASGRLQTRDALLPQVGARYRFADSGWEFFSSYSENIAAFTAGRDGPFSATQAAFDATVDALQPETSKMLEAGVRYSSERLIASAAAYAVEFNDRLLNIAQCVGIIGCANSFANVGTVDTRGVELTLRWQANARLSWLNTLSHNDSQYADDYLDGTIVRATAGKDVVDSPRRLFASELVYRHGALEARVAAKFTDKRYYTYVNDGSVPAFWRLDAGLAYQWPEPGWPRSVRLQLNATNLFDARYFATVGSNGFRPSDPAGTNYTLLAGAPRQLFLSVEMEF
ncbi:MAG TPA: TonB-dependent receptor [Arenimonas sp.]|nr:TonB-dependent receptor [Arenimonas sp.]